MPNSFGLNRSLGGAIAAIAVVLLLSSGAVLFSSDQLSMSAIAAQLGIGKGSAQ